MRYLCAPFLCLLLVIAAPAHAAGCSTPRDSRCESWTASWDSGLNETPEGAYPERPYDSLVLGGSLFIAGESFDGKDDSDAVLLQLRSSDGKLQRVNRYGGRSKVEGRDLDRATALAKSPDDKTIFVAGTQNSDDAGRGDLMLVAYDVASGAKLWDAAGHRGRAYGSDVAVSPDGSTVYVAGSAHFKGYRREILVVAFDASSGMRRWKRHYGEPGGRDFGGQVVATGGRVIVNGDVVVKGKGTHSVTVAYDARHRHRVMWSQDRAAAGAVHYGSQIELSPDGRRLFVTGQHSLEGGESQPLTEVAAFDPASGALRWSTASDKAPLGLRISYHLAAGPAGEVYVAGVTPEDQDGFAEITVVALDGMGGSRLWTTRYEPDSTGVYPTDLGAGDQGAYLEAVIIKPLGRDVATIALDRGTGAVRWEARFDPVDSLEAEATGGPLVIGPNDDVYSATEVYSGTSVSGHGYGRSDIWIAAYR